MNSCEGWNAGNMETQSCATDFWFIRLYADFYYTFIMFSSFMLLLPVLSYIILCLVLTEILGRKLRKTIDKKVNGI